MTRARTVTVIGLASLVALAACTAVLGADDGAGTRRPVTWAKLSSSLTAVLRAERADGRGLAVARASGLRVKNGRVLVVAESRGALAKTVAAVNAIRGVVVASHANLVQAYVTPAALGPLSGSASVAYLRTPKVPVFGGVVSG